MGRWPRLLAHCLVGFYLPGIACVILVLAINVFGEGLRDILDLGSRSVRDRRIRHGQPTAGARPDHHLPDPARLVRAADGMILACEREKLGIGRIRFGKSVTPFYPSPCAAPRPDRQR
jgi:hypothetical protein